MARIESWFAQDLKKPVKVHYLDGNVFSVDNKGNLVGVEVFDNGIAANLSGTVSGTVIRPDGATVGVSGTLSSNKAYIVLPQAAYALPGTISIVVKLTTETETTTLLAVVANVYMSSTDSIVDPGTIIPSVEALIAAIDAAVASIPLDYSELSNTVTGINDIDFVTVTLTSSSTNLNDTAVTNGSDVYFKAISTDNPVAKGVRFNGRYTDGGTNKVDTLAYVPFGETAHAIVRRAYDYIQAVVDPWVSPFSGNISVQYAISKPADRNEISNTVKLNMSQLSGGMTRVYNAQKVLVVDRVVESGSSIIARCVSVNDSNVTGFSIVGRWTENNTLEAENLANNVPIGKIVKVVTTRKYERIQFVTVPATYNDDGVGNFVVDYAINPHYDNDLYQPYFNNYPVPPITKSRGTFNADIDLDNVPHAMRDYTISAHINVTTMGSVAIVTGTDTASRYALEVNATKAIVTRADGSTAEFTHGLTIADRLNISIHAHEYGKATIVLNTVGGTYVAENVTWAACLFFRKVAAGSTLTSYLKLTRNSGTYGAAQFEFFARNYERDVWMFGDSYFTMWPPYCVQYGYGNFGQDGFSGRAAYEGYQSMLFAFRFHIPKKIVWALGMNNTDNASTGTINQAWYDSYLAICDLCKAYNIELILCTIPTTQKTVDGVRTRYHEYKNNVIRNSGYRVIDIADALGATLERNFVWFDGLEGTDLVHPTPLGCEMIANTIMTEVPEIAEISR